MATPPPNPVAWKIKYGKKELDAAATKCVFLQSFGPGFSTAVHTFITRARLEGDSSENNLEELLLPLVEKGKELEFYFSDLPEKDQTVTHSHIVYSTLLESSRKDGKRENKFTVVTVEKRMLWHVSPRTKFFQAEDARDIVSAIATENGLEVDSERMEPCPLPLEFQALLQASLTDHDFVTSRLQARSPGDFRIFTTDGKTVGYSTLGFKADDPIKLFPEDVLDVADSGDSFETILRGGSTMEFDAFDPLVKKSLSASSTGPPVVLSNQQPLHSGLRQEWYPLRTQEAVDTWTRSWQKRAAWGYGYAILIRGVFKLGEQQAEIKPNLRVTLEGTKYRAYDKQTGLVVAVKHEYRRSAYTLTLYCVADAASYP